MAAPQQLSTTTGLLAFIWDIYTNASKSDQFKSNPVGMMNQYQLTIDQQRVIWSAGLNRDDPANAAAWDTLAGGGTLPAGSKMPPLVDTDWANPDAMALLGSMIVDILAGTTQWKAAW